MAGGSKPPVESVCRAGCIAWSNMRLTSAEAVVSGNVPRANRTSRPPFRSNSATRSAVSQAFAARPLSAPVAPRSTPSYTWYRMSRPDEGEDLRRIPAERRGLRRHVRCGGGSVRRDLFDVRQRLGGCRLVQGRH